MTSSYEGGQLGVFLDNGMVEQLTERFGANRFLYACKITTISRTLEIIPKIQTRTHIYAFSLCSSVIGCGSFVCSGCCWAVVLVVGGREVVCNKMSLRLLVALMDTT